MTPTRITLSRAKGWRKPAGAVIVARPSIWGNPWGVGSPGTVDLVVAGAKARYLLDIDLTAAQAVAIYELWLDGGAIDQMHLPPVLHEQNAGRAVADHLHASRKIILANLHQLHGRDLCCWCKPGQPCHADVLLRLAKGEA